ncbi:MAG: two-component regulator propeller domain-containing protein [Chitinophagales bacterium]|nr:two-component regulator propeller domain-containing protein [Chitinophagales bacterium]
MLILILIAHQLAFAQSKQHQFHNLSINDGLSQSAVSAICQDSMGFMWFGTKDGLNRYDGFGFKIYRNNKENAHSIAGNHVNFLMLDSKSNLWVATNGGLDLYLPEKDHFKHILFPTPSSVRNYAVTCLYEDKYGNFWVGTESEGLLKLGPNYNILEHFRFVFQDTNSIPSSHIACITGDNQGYVYVGSKIGGLCRIAIATGKIKRYSPSKETLYRNHIESLSNIGGKIWIGTIQGLNILDPATDIISPAKQLDCYKLPWMGGVLLTAFQDANNEIWLSYGSIGLRKLKMNANDCVAVNLLTGANNFYPDNIISIYQDRSGLMWLGTNGGGVFCYYPGEKFELYTHNPLDSSSVVARSIRAIMVAANGDLYVGGYAGMSVFKKNGRYKHFVPSPTSDKPSINPAVYCITEDIDHNIWIGSEGGGLQLFNPSNETFENFHYGSLQANGAPQNVIYKIFVDSQGSLWAGSDAGLSRYNREKERFEYVFGGGIITDLQLPVRDIKELKPGCFFLSTDKGLYYINTLTQNVQELTDKLNNKLICQKIFSTIIDGNTLWIATDGCGLKKMKFRNVNDNQIQIDSITHIEAIQASVIYGIIQDKLGILWLSSNVGLFSYDKSGTVNQFTSSDGLQSNEFNSGAYFKDQTGKLYFGGINGFNAFYPEKMPFNKAIPKVVLTKLMVNNQLYNSDQPFHTIKTLKLNSDYNVLSFEFAALDFVTPQKNQYAYMLEGFDKDWVYSGSRNFASYTNLPPGTYTFKVKASNNDYAWNEEGLLIAVTIVPPFYKNLSFIIPFTLLVILAIGVLIRSRIKSLERQQKALEEKVRIQTELMKMEKLKNEIEVSKALLEGQNMEQKRIAEDLHDGIGQTLTAANMNLMTLEHNVKSAEGRNSELMESLRMLLNHAITEVRNISHNLMPNLMMEEGLEVALAELSSRTMKSGRINIVLNIDELPPSLPQTAQINLYRIIQEIINNTLKHSFAKNLYIDMIIKGKNLFLETRDDGLGFDLNKTLRKGIGLKNIKIRTQLLDGVFEIKSASGKGTIIHITIPLKHEMD